MSAPQPIKTILSDETYINYVHMQCSHSEATFNGNGQLQACWVLTICFVVSNICDVVKKAIHTISIYFPKNVYMLCDQSNDTMQCSFMQVIHPNGILLKLPFIANQKSELDTKLDITCASLQDMLQNLTLCPKKHKPKLTTGNILIMMNYLWSINA